MNSLMIRRLRPYKTPISVVLHAVVVSVIATLCLVMPAHAAKTDTGAKITITPVSAKLDLSPGKKLDGSFTIINDGSVKYDFKVYASPYTVSGENYEQSFAKETNRTQIARWITFEKDTYTIEPGQKILVNYTVDVPSDLASGGQYAALFAQTDLRTDERDTVTTQKRVGLLLYGRTTGGDTRLAVDVRPNPMPLFVLGNKTSAGARVVNTGNVDVDAKVTVETRDLFGKKAFEASRSNIVLPDTTRLIENEWKELPVFGIYNTNITVETLGKEYTSSSATIIISPLFAIMMFGIVIVIIGGAIYVFKRGKKTS